MSKPVELLKQKLETLETSESDINTMQEQIRLLKRAIAYGIKDYSERFLNDSSTVIDTSDLKMDLVGNALCMFQNCSNLKSVDTSNWCKGFLFDATHMFYGCSSLTSLDMSHWDTSNLCEASSMFYGCSSLTSLDMSSWELPSIEACSTMFNGCSSLKTLIMTGATAKVLGLDNERISSISCSNVSSLDDKTVYILSGAVDANTRLFVVTSADPKPQ